MPLLASVLPYYLSRIKTLCFHDLLDVLDFRIAPLKQNNIEKGTPIMIKACKTQ